jgi:AcrR family transcriptional regulator
LEEVPHSAAGRLPALTETLTNVPSRREKHKARTRQALRETALQLFASQGFDSTTAEEIAEQVGVSARTFFRYFATKESALFIGRHDWIEAFGAMYLVQPAAMTDVEALLASYVLVAPRLTRRRRALQQYERAVASSPSLRGREQDYREADVAALAGAIARRRGLSETDEDCRLLASVSFLTHRRALDNWLAGSASADLADTITDEFERLARFFTEHR